MRFLFFTISFFALLFISRAGGGEIKSHDIKGPLVITSSSFTADHTARTALFEGLVKARTDEVNLSADKMLVFYASGGKIKKIEVTGQVRLVRGNRVITSDTALYLGDDERIVFLGKPTAREGDNIVVGTKMTYLIREDRSVVENGRVSMSSGSPRQR